MEGEKQIGRYILQEELGHGGMAVVHKAYDPMLDRAVALKMLRVSFQADDAAFERVRQRFVMEARIAANLSHPNIVVVHDFGVEPATRSLYIAMELLEGDTVRAWVRKNGPMSSEALLPFALQIAEALKHAHGQGIVHRDVKPSNLMVLPDRRVKILDFGIAKVTECQVTLSGEFLGSPAFASPEQLSGQTIDARSDLFSLGSVLYFALSGNKPFKAEKISDLLLEIVYGDPVPLAEAAPGVSQRIVGIVTRLMARDPAVRYQTADEVRGDLQRAIDGLTRDTVPISSDDIPVRSIQTTRMRRIAWRKPKLSFLTGPFEGREVQLDKDKAVIGRHHADVVVPDREISGNHCLIEIGEDGCILRDLKSKNGTWVGGNAVEEISIVSGEVFRIGKTEIRFLLEPEIDGGPGMETPEPFEEVVPEVESPWPESAPEAGSPRIPVPPAFGGLEDVAAPKTPGSPEGSTPVPVSFAPPAESNPLTLVDVEVTSLGKQQKKKAAPKNMAYKLEVLDGPEQGTNLELSEVRTVIGRQDCQINVKDNRISRKHAEIEIRGLNTVYLRDLASTNGTFLNDGEISTVQLKSGDVIKVGNTRFRFTTHQRSE